MISSVIIICIVVFVSIRFFIMALPDDLPAILIMPTHRSSRPTCPLPLLHLLRAACILLEQPHASVTVLFLLLPQKSSSGVLRCFPPSRQSSLPCLSPSLLSSPWSRLVVDHPARKSYRRLLHLKRGRPRLSSRIICDSSDPSGVNRNDLERMCQEGNGRSVCSAIGGA